MTSDPCGCQVSNLGQPLEMEAISSPELSPRSPCARDLDQPPVLKRERPLEVNGCGRDSSPASSDSDADGGRPPHARYADAPFPVNFPLCLFPAFYRQNQSDRLKPVILHARSILPRECTRVALLRKDIFVF